MGGWVFDEMKVCRVCNLTKPLDEFYKDRIKKDGRASSCKECSKIRVRAWAESNPERSSDATKRWRQRNLDRLPHYNRKWEYGLGADDYERILSLQKGLCMICLSPPRKGESLCVDHSHQTGRIRGLLCRKCNSGLGFFEDNPALLLRASDYVIGVI